MKKAARSQQAASVCGISVPPSYSETTQQSTSRPKEKEVTNADCSICGQQLSFSVINQRESASIAANVRVGTATCPVCDARYRIRITKIRDSNLSRDELRILRRQQDQAKETKHDPQSS
jgi:transcription elongation factor Elf1